MKPEDINELEEAARAHVAEPFSDHFDGTDAQRVLDLITTFRSVDAARSALQQFVDQQESMYLLAQAVHLLSYYRCDADSPMQQWRNKASALLKDYDEDAETERRAAP